MLCLGTIPAELMDASQDDHLPRRRISVNVDAETSPPLPSPVDISRAVREDNKAISTSYNRRILSPVESTQVVFQIDLDQSKSVFRSIHFQIHFCFNPSIKLSLLALFSG